MAEESKLVNLFSGIAQNMCNAVTQLIVWRATGYTDCGDYIHIIVK